MDDGEGENDKEEEDEAAAFDAAVRGTAVPAAEVEAELALVSNAAAQVSAFKIAMREEQEEEEQWDGGTGESGGKKKKREASSREAVVAEEVGPVSDAVACRIALRDC